MARELTIEVRAEGADQTQQDLAKVEARLQGVGQAAEKAGAATDKYDDAQRHAGQSAQGTSIGVQKLTNALITFAGPAAVGMAVRRTLDLADNIKELSQQSGFSTDAIQTLGHVANKAGSSFQAVANAANALDRNLQTGGDRIIGAVTRLGLSVDDLLSMQPEDRFRALGVAIGSTANPAERAELAMTLFGRAGRDLLPMFDDLAAGAEENAPKMSNAWVEANATIADSLDDLQAKGMTVLNWFLGWPSVLSAWAAEVGATLRSAWDNVAPNVPGMPGRPNSPLLAPPALTFDPLNGQSMGFVERTLTQGAQASIRAATGGGGAARVLPFVRPSLMGESQGYNVLQAQMYNGVGFPGMTGGFGGLGFPGWSGPAPLAARQNLNFAPYAGSVPMDAPGARGGGFGSMLSGLFKSSYGSGFGGFLSGAGGGIAAGLGSLFTKGADKAQGIGSMIGGIAGGFLGPLGSIAGSFLGGKLGGLFGGGEGKTTNRTRDAWIGENFGSVDKLREAAAEAGFSLDRMLSTKKVKDFESEVKKLQAAMGESEQDAQRVGEAMDRWGISIDEMGPKFKQTKINDAFKEALDDIRVLTNAGADFNVIAEKMAPTLGGMVHEAIEMGGTVPREMEPVLKKMIELGLLTDKNGDKFTDLSQIPFAADLNKDFTTLIGKMDALISRLAGIPSLFGEATDAATEFANATPDGSGLPTRPETGEAGMDGGGTVGRTWRQRSMRDTVPMWLRPGEVVLTPEQARGGMSVSIGSVSVGGGASRAQTAESVGEAVVAYMERRGVRFGRRVA